MGEAEEIVSYISSIDEILKVNNFLNDKVIEDALNDLVKMTVKPEIPDVVAKKLIVKLQAISGTCSIRATYYSALDKGTTGTEQFKKKSLYYTLAKVLDDLVNALKYYVKKEY